MKSKNKRQYFQVCTIGFLFMQIFENDTILMQETNNFFQETK